MNTQMDEQPSGSPIGDPMFWIIVIIAAIVALAIPSFMRARTKRIKSHKSACIGNLLHISSGKDQMAMDLGFTNGWAAWDGVDGYNPATDDIAAISNWVEGATGYIKQYPLCPSSTTEVQNAAQTVNDYRINPIGSNAVCRIRGGSKRDDHALSK